MEKLQPSYLKSDVPAGRCGDWVVERFRVPEPPDPKQDLRPHWSRSKAGRYTRLSVAATVMMTDTYEEWWTQKEAVEQACRRGGRVLISGLGLGLVAESIFRTPGSAVEHITIVEASSDVIRLVGPYLAGRYGERLVIEQASAFEWRPPAGVHYTVGWHDIWANPYDQERIFPEVRRLESRYSGCCDWQGFWPLECAAAAEASGRD